MMIQLQLLDGSPVVANSDQIAYFHPSDVGPLFVLPRKTSIHVQDDFEAVAESRNPQRQSAEPCWPNDGNRVG